MINELNDNKLSLVLLAGGKSTRFGTKKEFVSFSGRTPVERIIKNLEGCCSEILFAVNNIEQQLYLEQNISSMIDILKCHNINRLAPLKMKIPHFNVPALRNPAFPNKSIGIYQIRINQAVQEESDPLFSVG